MPITIPSRHLPAGAQLDPVQASFDDLGTPLSEVAFVVVDLETTGSRTADSMITEVGAVKVRGGEVLGEFQTLVNPGVPIPAFIAVLTGITDRMVADAPVIDTVLPAFFEFARGCVLVAHNAPFDVGFLKASASALGLRWPGFTVVDTVALARQLIHRDEAPNRKLSTLATLFGTEVTPDHRALNDAKATVDVLHALIGRVGNLGVHTLEELTAFTARVSDAQRRRRYLADRLPAAPGVYLFKDGSGRVLYVGTSQNIRVRVRSYFTSAERRTRIAEMVGIAESVTPVICATPLEARVRELRLIAEHDPPYNRRSRSPERRPWIKLTAEPFPRLCVVRDVRPDGATYAGPFASRRGAQSAVDALHEVLPLRQCTVRLSAHRNSAACVLAELGRCLAPCLGRVSETQYAATVSKAVGMLAGDCREVVGALAGRLRDLSASERYEEAGVLRDRLLALVGGAARAQRLRPLALSPELVAARRASGGGWEVVCIRYGRLAGTSVTPAGADPMPFIDALQAGAEVVPAPCAPASAASPEEGRLLLDWLETDGIRLVSLIGEWSSPLNGAGSARLQLTARFRAEEPLNERAWAGSAGAAAEWPTLARPPGMVHASGDARRRY